MKLYVVLNGFTGNSQVYCTVIAETEERAIELAKIKYKQKAKEFNYDSSFYNNLYTECLCEDTDKEYTGAIED